MAANANATEASSSEQPQFASSAASMNRILNETSDRPTDRSTRPIHGHPSHTNPGDGGRVFADPPPDSHPSMQYTSDGRNFRNSNSYHASPGDISNGAAGANFATPWGFSHSSALPYGQGWGGYGIVEIKIEYLS